MMHAKRALAGLVGLMLAACSAALDADLPATTRSPSLDAGEATTAPSAAGDVGLVATGIVLVHAAAFPSFRLCFQNQPTLQPQPDSKIMPESNVVGVETGSFVRLGPMDAPGSIYVIDERRVRDRTESCGELLTNGTLNKGNDYDVILAPLDRDLGRTGVDVVALTGCANEITLENLGIAQEACGAGYVQKSGNLRAEVISLQPSRAAPAGAQLPVQLYQLSTAVAAVAAKGQLAVSFGTLSAPGPLGQELGVAPLFTAGPQTALSFDPSSEAVYATQGFRITVGPTTSPITVDQSLATVQDLSSSNELPTTYYSAASNYALLLLGDPSFRADAGATSARLGMHLLAVPVIDPAAADAGAEDAGAPAPADGG